MNFNPTIVRGIVVACFYIFSTIVSEADNYPFPRGYRYAFGIAPANAKSDHAKKEYENWKSAYYEDFDGDRGRVFFNGAKEVVSEGIAYGMLLAVYAGDQNVFDRLWRYYQSHVNDHGLMNWKINKADEVVGWNAATDAEEDAAMALIAAHYNWGSSGSINYLADVKYLLGQMMEHEVEKNTYVLKPGDVWGGSDVTNPSYLAPAYYRIFADISGDQNWLKVLDKSYEILYLNADPQTGLVSDWCTAEGTKVSNQGMKIDFYYDATRAPWRIATDMLWYGEERAKTLCTRMSDFLRDKVKNPANIVDGYKRNGEKTGSNHNPAFVGPFAVVIMGTESSAYQKQMNTAYTELINTPARDYFSSCLKSISLFVLTGNFYKLPEYSCSVPALGADVSLCRQPEYTLDGTVKSAGFRYKWSTGATTEKITVNAPGAYWVRADSAGCAGFDTVSVNGVIVDLGPDTAINMSGAIISVRNHLAEGSQLLWSTGESTGSIAVNLEGEYWLQVDSAGCRGSDTLRISYIESDTVKIYPNPVSSSLHVLFHDVNLKQLSYELCNADGKQLQRSDSYRVTRGIPLVIDMEELAGGYYFLKTSILGQVKVYKIYKE